MQLELRKAEARELAKQGKSAGEIAQILNLSRRQIEYYLRKQTIDNIA
jgi:DNA-binding CsgD family transcriptional regulator